MALGGTQQLRSQRPVSVHLRCTQGVTRLDGPEGANGDENRDGNEDGGGNGDRNGDGGGNRDGGGKGGGKGTGAGTVIGMGTERKRERRRRKYNKCKKAGMGTRAGTEENWSGGGDERRNARRERGQKWGRERM